MEFRRALPEEEVCPVCGAVFRKNQCYRCGHTWRQRKDTPPGTCPSCRSPFWNRLYMRPEHSRKQKQW